MKIDNLIGVETLEEANIVDKIMKEPGRAKQLNIAWRHDDTLPPNEVAKLGPKPDDKSVATEWSSMLEKTLERTNYGDLSKDFKFAEWLTKLFTTGAADWEDISGEGGDALGAWHALSQRGLLNTKHQDLNKFRTLRQLQQAVVNNNDYQAELQRIKNAAEIAKMKKDKKDLIIIDDDKYWVAIPFNYGACYVFNNTGHISNFCTGGSSGMRWFNNYAPSGPMVMIVDKANIDKPDGKWQMHADTNQLVNSVQDYRYDQGEHFGKLFPGLMRKIISTMAANSNEIQNASKDITPNRAGYNVSTDIARIKSKFPKSLTKAKDEPDEPEPELPGAPGSEGWFNQYLSQDFQNLLDPNAPNQGYIRLTRNDGKKIRGPSITLDQIFTMVYQRRPEWLQPGTVTSAEWAPEA